jgi:hypothetical protein
MVLLFLDSLFGWADDREKNGWASGLLQTNMGEDKIVWEARNKLY